MKNIHFTKMVASGNDFIVIEESQVAKLQSYPLLTRKLCDRKYGIGSDGALFLEKSKRADGKMRIFNADGSEAEMCGNGARCIALYLSSKLKVQSSQLKIETKAGIILSEVNRAGVKIKLTDPKGLKLNIPIKVNNRLLKVNFINTGVPHAVIFVEGLEKINVVNLGRQIRFHGRFHPAGTNVNFAEATGSSSIKVRTYERGVEDETLACGTGSVASALIFSHQVTLPVRQAGRSPGHQVIKVATRSKETLRIYFIEEKNIFRNVWLEGQASIVYKGQIKLFS